METTARFLNGVYPFEGKGLDAPYPLADALTYTVPADKRAQRVDKRRAGRTEPRCVVGSAREDDLDVRARRRLSGDGAGSVGRDRSRRRSWAGNPWLMAGLGQR